MMIKLTNIKYNILCIYILSKVTSSNVFFVQPRLFIFFAALLSRHIKTLLNVESEI